MRSYESMWQGIALVAGAALLWLMLRRWGASWSRRRRWAHARRVESGAPKLLAARGYRVVGAQVPSSYSLLVDGRSVKVSLRADYIVTCNGRSFVAEVKSGKAAPQLTTAATRRQLLEYSLAFDVDGMLLVDGEAGEIHEIEFSNRAARPPGAPLRGSIVWLVIAAALLGLFFWFLRQ